MLRSKQFRDGARARICFTVLFKKISDTTEEIYKHANALETISWATNLESPIQDENQWCNEEYYNNATKSNKYSK